MGGGGREGHFWVDSRDAIASKNTLIKQPFEHLVAVAADSWLVKSRHDRLVGGAEALGRDLVVVSLLDSLDPLILLVLRSRKHRVGVDILLVDQQEAVGPYRIPRKPPANY